jgi:hypothetical protein
MEGIIFLIRHTPFWAIPAFIISAEAFYWFWSRDRKKFSSFFFGVMGVALAGLTFYYWAGGPEKSVKSFINFIYYIS